MRVFDVAEPSIIETGSSMIGIIVAAIVVVGAIVAFLVLKNNK